MQPEMMLISQKKGQPLSLHSLHCHPRLAAAVDLHFSILIEDWYQQKALLKRLAVHSLGNTGLGVQKHFTKF